MNTQQAIDLYKSSRKMLEDLNTSLISKVYEAIKKAEVELGVGFSHFYGLKEYIRAPFGEKPSGVAIIENIIRKASSTEEKVFFIEHVFMGSSHSYEYQTSDIKVIAKYLQDN